MKTIPATLLVLAAVLEILFAALVWLKDLRSHLAETITIYLISSLVYLVSVRFAVKISTGGSRRRVIFILGTALLFRLTVWPLFPALSDDAYRYRWEGKLQAAGGNPYQARPNDSGWAGLRDETFPLVVGKDFKAGYGPLVELIESLTYRAASALTPDPRRQVFWFKAPFALFDLGVMAALLALLKTRGLAPERVLVYAWSPLPVMEFWATGHNDSVVVLFLILALLAAARERWTLSFAGLSLAVAAKLWPLALFPVFVGWKGLRPQRAYQWWVSVPIVGALAWPYWSDVTENARFMSGFLGGWRNNDSVFGLLLWLTGDIYRAKYLAFGIVAAAAAFVTVRGWRIEKAVLAVIVVMLAVSANCHPWYLTWMLPLVALFPVPALLLWTALAPLAHIVVIDWVRHGEWRGSTGLRWLIYGPVAAAASPGKSASARGISRLLRRAL